MLENYKPISAERIMEMVAEDMEDDYEEPTLLACGIFMEEYWENLILGLHRKRNMSIEEIATTLDLPESRVREMLDSAQRRRQPELVK